MRFKIAVMYLDETLSYCHSEYEIRCSAYFSPKKNSDGTYDYSYGSHYMSITVYNNFGYEVDSSIFSKIEKEMPKVNYYVNLYDYLKTKVDYEIAYAYVRELVCPLYDAKLDDDVVKSIEEYIKEYD